MLNNVFKLKERAHKNSLNKHRQLDANKAINIIELVTCCECERKKIIDEFSQKIV